MRHPFDNYLYALLLSGKPHDKIIEACVEKDLVFVDFVTDHINTLERNILDRAPKAYDWMVENRGKNVSPKQSIRKYFNHVIYDTRVVFSPEDPDIVGAVWICEHKLARDTIEVLTLQEIPRIEICALIKDKFGYGLSTSTISCYCFYFWDIDGLRIPGFSKYLDRIPAYGSPKKVQKLAIYTDPEIIRARYRLPMKPDLKYMTDSMLVQSYHKFNEAIQFEKFGTAIYIMEAFSKLLKSKVDFGDLDPSGKELVAAFMESIKEVDSTKEMKTVADIQNTEGQ